MRQSWFVLLAAATIVFAGCAPTENEPRSSEQSIQSNKEDLGAALEDANIVIHYMDETQYTGNELQIVQTINKYMKAQLDYDFETQQETFSVDHPYKNETIEKQLSVIVSLDNPRFNVLTDGNIEVFVEQKQVTLGATLTVDESEKLYLMTKEGSEWKILSVTN